MSNLVIVGIQWGDEGKGKIVDLLTPEFDAVVRFQGGANAGHTIVIGGRKTVLHLVPSGVLHKGVDCVIASGVVLDPVACLDEIGMLKKEGFLGDTSKLSISDRAHVIFSYHKTIDALREKALDGAHQIGTTGRGIGPAYEDKVSRCGIRCAELIDKNILRDRLKATLPQKNEYVTKILGGKAAGIDELVSEYATYGERLRPYVKDTGRLINSWIAAGRKIMFEGAQGTALDVDHGTYPFVTSSNTVAPNAATGSGVPPSVLNDILGVAKAYCTRVGGGPFMTELKNSVGEHLRARGGEFGSTTGRARRCGWLDLAYLKYSAELNGVTRLALTKLDVLTGMDGLKLCVGYNLRGEKIDYVPPLAEDLEMLRPEYMELAGWAKSLGGVKKMEGLPKAAREYIEFIEGFLKIPVALVSTGSERESYIRR